MLQKTWFQIEGADTSKYKDPYLIMLFMQKNPIKQPIHKLKGFAIVAKVWLELSNKLKE
jgi:hypothetical protein